MISDMETVDFIFYMSFKKSFAYCNTALIFQIPPHILSLLHVSSSKGENEDHFFLSFDLIWASWHCEQDISSSVGAANESLLLYDIVLITKKVY